MLLQKKDGGQNDGDQKKKAAATAAGEEAGGGGSSTVVLKMDLHCDGCAKKVKGTVKRFDGNLSKSFILVSASFNLVPIDNFCVRTRLPSVRRFSRAVS